MLETVERESTVWLPSSVGSIFDVEVRSIHACCLP